MSQLLSGMKVLHTKNSFIGTVQALSGDVVWFREMDGGYHTFHKDNLVEVKSFRLKPVKITSDQSHADLVVNDKVISTNLEEIQKVQLDKIAEFMR